MNVRSPRGNPDALEFQAGSCLLEDPVQGQPAPSTSQRRQERSHAQRAEHGHKKDTADHDPTERAQAPGRGRPVSATECDTRNSAYDRAHWPGDEHQQCALIERAAKSNVAQKHKSNRAHHRTNIASAGSSRFNVIRVHMREFQPE
jgi:hypothetical protein